MEFNSGFKGLNTVQCFTYRS